jgi:Protein of unknown function (DUF3017)
VTTPAPQPRPQRRRFAQWPLAVVLGCFAAGLAVVATEHFRRGSALIGGSLLLAAGLRLILSPREAGLLVVRSRAFDVAFLALTGLGILALAFSVRAPA